MHIVEAWGTGLPRIINRCKEYGLPDPLFEEFGDGFKVTLFRKVSNAPELLQGKNDSNEEITVGSKKKQLIETINRDKSRIQSSPIFFNAVLQYS
jgi:predicted HTH transcriptional regulator